ncbi:MAG: hypothetical protein FJ297_17250 [Planctomycetes bacterium]|nr:hypothetical protein [Planctomycetota bacterium]
MKYGSCAALCVMLIAAATADAQSYVRYGTIIQEQAPAKPDAVQAPIQAPMVQAHDAGCGCGTIVGDACGCSPCSGWWSGYCRPRYLCGYRFGLRGCGPTGLGACGGTGGWAGPNCACASCGVSCGSPCCGFGHYRLRGCGRCAIGCDTGCHTSCGCGVELSPKDAGAPAVPMDPPTPEPAPAPST